MTKRKLPLRRFRAIAFDNAVGGTQSLSFFKAKTKQTGNQCLPRKIKTTVDLNATLVILLWLSLCNQQIDHLVNIAKPGVIFSNRA